MTTPKISFFIDGMQVFSADIETIINTQLMQTGTRWAKPKEQCCLRIEFAGARKEFHFIYPNPRRWED